MQITGAVQAHVKTRSFGTDPQVPGQVLVTDGLRVLGHRELAFAFAGQATLEPLVPLLRAIASAAEQGMGVQVGGVTRLGGLLPFGGPAPGFQGVVYARPSAMDGLIDAEGLVALLATSAELDMVEAFGLRRVLSRLAQTHCYYPYPPWSDPARARLSAMHDEGSMLHQIARLAVVGATVTRASSVEVAGATLIELRLSRARSASLLQQLASLPRNAALTLLMNEVDPNADGCLVWCAGQTGPSAVAPPNSAGVQLGGCHLTFVPEQADNASQLLEDGYAYFLRDADWAVVRDALMGGQDLQVRGAAAGDDLFVRWLP